MVVKRLLKDITEGLLPNQDKIQTWIVLRLQKKYNEGIMKFCFLRLESLKYSKAYRL